MNIKIINTSKHSLPEYETLASAGMDLRANIELPIGIEAQVRPRSGLAAKKGVTVLNAPGTIDADYRGEIGVILVNLSNKNFTIENGERIAQLIIAKHERVSWHEVEVLDKTERGAGGFGSTGVK